jgi:2-keto-4-pentenoate hydratase/2-oxohepta-3-ene-1,7-dioic acid hydratase in catechol pathway
MQRYNPQSAEADIRSQKVGSGFAPSGSRLVESGDIFSCGTCGGVGQGTNSFLKIGDVMETEVESLGKRRNRFVAETA